jgi:hypothetical protein
MMLDGPTSFLLVMALLGLAALGTFGILACLAALCSRRRRQEALRWCLFGVSGGLTSLLVISGLILAALGSVPPSASVFWRAVAFPAGFAIGGAVRVSARLFFDRERPVSERL